MDQTWKLLCYSSLEVPTNSSDHFIKAAETSENALVCRLTSLFSLPLLESGNNMIKLPLSDFQEMYYYVRKKVKKETWQSNRAHTKTLLLSLLFSRVSKSWLSVILCSWNWSEQRQITVQGDATNCRREGQPFKWHSASLWVGRSSSWGWACLTLIFAQFWSHPHLMAPYSNQIQHHVEEYFCLKDLQSGREIR